MSMHKKPLTRIEEEGLRAHGLEVGSPSQLSDAFRQGVAWALSSAAPEQEPVDETKGGTFCRICGTKLCVTGVCTIYCPNRDCGVPGRGTKALTKPELERLKAGQPVFDTNADQSGPVALPKRRDSQDIARHGHGTWNQCLDEIAKLGPLYTHADPSEVEQLRAENKRLMHTSVKEEVFEIVCKERDAATQRAEVAERKLGDLLDLLRVVDRCGLDAIQVSGPTVRQRVREALLSSQGKS